MTEPLRKETENKETISEKSNLSEKDKIVIKNNIEIFPDLPLPEFNTIGGKAYAAKYKNDSYLSLYAIVCTSIFFPRTESIKSMLTVESSSVLKLAASSIEKWTDGNQYTILVYQKPLESKFSKTLKNLGLIKDSVIKNFIASMAKGLYALQSAGLVHDAINPDNIYWDAISPEGLQLGEFLSFPSGSLQPAAFLSIERAMAMPLGRGPGQHTEDIYAFGITLAQLILGKKPFEGKTDEEIIRLKQESGSFVSLMKGEKTSPQYTEILRGTLSDDAQNRMTAYDLVQLLEGRKYTLKSSDRWRKTIRAFPFMGKDYWFVSSLSNALSKNPAEAAKLIENASIDKWVERSVPDEDKAENIRDIIKFVKQEGGSNYIKKLVSMVNIVLDPYAPIRYENIQVMPKGIPVALVDAFENNGHINALSEIIGSKLTSMWFEKRADSSYDLPASLQMFEKMKAAVHKTAYGSGIERAIYEGNQSIPCLSPIVRKYYILKPSQLIEVLEEIGLNDEEKSALPIDRHIAAFLTAKGVITEKSCNGLDSFDKIEKAITVLNIFTTLQSRYGGEKMPGLCKWIGSQTLDIILLEYKNLDTREKLRKQAEHIIREGNIGKLLHLIDNKDIILKDIEDLKLSKELYSQINQEIESLQKPLSDSETVGMTLGRDIAVMLSVLCSMAMIGFFILKEVLF